MFAKRSPDRRRAPLLQPGAQKRDTDSQILSILNDHATMHEVVQSVVHVHPSYTILLSVLGITLKPMCQEGIHLVRRPLKVYPHVKTIQTDEEGMELAELMGSDKAVLMQGHGAVTTGATLEESVMGMVHLEEQARMNYMASCASGGDYACVPGELIDEMTNRTPLEDLPHFKDSLRGIAPQRAGIWNYRVLSVSQDL